MAIDLEIVKSAKSTLGFIGGVYHVESFPGHSLEGWHCVSDVIGFNCLSFIDAPGAKFTTLENATAICELWNSHN